METNAFASDGPIQIGRQIDLCCQEFEYAWKNNETPVMEDFIGRVANTGRIELIRELFALQSNYRRNDLGQRLTDSQLCDLHPQLMPDIAEQAKFLRAVPANTSEATLTHVLTGGVARTKKPSQPTSSSGSSRGLHIRCPHCSNPVELISDTAFESITCQTCGSAFSLVDNEERTIEAPTLKKIGRFELVSRLGMGGFGTVWKARDTELERSVAVKMPRKGAAFAHGGRAFLSRSPLSRSASPSKHRIGARSRARQRDHFYRK